MLTPTATQIDDIRARLAKRDPCDPACPGWCTTDRGTVERCDECCADLADPVSDDEVALLPNTQATLNAMPAD